MLFDQHTMQQRDLLYISESRSCLLAVAAPQSANGAGIVGQDARKRRAEVLVQLHHLRKQTSST